MPKNQRRASQGGGAERHGRAQSPRRGGKGQVGYNTSVSHRETRAQAKGARSVATAFDVPRAGGRRAGQAAATTGAPAGNGPLARTGKDGGRHRKMKGSGPASKKKGAAERSAARRR